MSFGGPREGEETRRRMRESVARASASRRDEASGRMSGGRSDAARESLRAAEGDGAGYPSLLAQPTDLASHPVYRPPAPVPSMPVAPPARSGSRASIWILGILGFALIGLVGYFVNSLGAAASAVGLVLALVPLAIVLLGVRLIDRWEPEPRSLVLFALAWGAVAAVGITLLVDVGLVRFLGYRDETLTSVVQAPIVEEAAKGLGVFLIFLVARRAFDGPVDGIVYGALVGAGFAFTENIQYFAVSLIEGGGADLTVTFVLRGLMSPFAHAMFTALTGFAIGFAARRDKPAGSVLRAGLLGLVGAIALHAFWNGSSVFGDFFALYLTAQVPLFLGFVLVIVGLRREEERLTRERLAEYAAAGWFTSQEVTMLATSPGRKAGLEWASGLREDRRLLMRTFIKDATALAALRQRVVIGRGVGTEQEEQLLLHRAQVTRAALLAY